MLYLVTCTLTLHGLSAIVMHYTTFFNEAKWPHVVAFVMSVWGIHITVCWQFCWSPCEGQRLHFLEFVRKQTGLSADCCFLSYCKQHKAVMRTHGTSECLRTPSWLVGETHQSDLCSEAPPGTCSGLFWRKLKRKRTDKQQRIQWTKRRHNTRAY